jgi:hypothetical protein
MGEKIVVGPINSGLVRNRHAFNIDNDSFPTLLNAYQWRGRVKRKRGTSLLGRLQRDIGTTDGNGDITVTIVPNTITSGISSFLIGSEVFTDPGGSSPVTLLATGSGSGTLNRSTGVLTITGSEPTTAVLYRPSLPVMGLEDFVRPEQEGTQTIAFDTVYSYNIQATSPYTISDVSYFKNPASATYTNYVAKGTLTPCHWNGENYQQFWTTSYAGSMWATNGIEVPYVSTNVGMQFKPIVATTVTGGGPPATVNLQIIGHGLVVGDFVFINEVVTTTGINFQTGYVTTVTDVDNVVVTFPNATIATNGTGGIAQYLTSTATSTVDCMRWYDGDPASASGKGWVNFCPPLSESNYSVGGLPPDQYYLVTARMVVQFKDRLLFIGPVVQTSSANSQVYLQDTIIYSQVGTPYYTASFTGNVSLSTTTFNPILVPDNEVATASAYFSDQTGFGGFFSAGLAQPFLSVSSNEDVLLLGMQNIQTRLIYTGNDLIPFNLYVVNSEFGSGSTFSAVDMDKGVFTMGSRGIIATSQTGAARLDLAIPDQIFRINLLDHGRERVTAIRDYINEWIYFTYRANTNAIGTYVFNTQTLFYNYRDNSWGIFNECYTTYGLFRRATGNTWADLVSPLTWGSLTDPWNAGDFTLLTPEVIGGNQQGFVVFREAEATSEATSLVIQQLSSYTVTCPNHCLNTGDFVVISGCQGSTNLNGEILKVAVAGQDTFTVSKESTGTYTGGGLITRAYNPFIQTKQFHPSWEMMRKTRLGVQQYLMTKTAKSQVTLLIFLSQDLNTPWNQGNIVPEQNVTNNSLIYSTVLYTCPESTNLGLTPANTNLNMLTASSQQQIWHRMNTSLIGDTVQVGITMNDTQMESVDDNGSPVNLFAEITLQGFILDVTPSQLLS